ncbi:MAG: HDIG domain-containing protein [Thermomicrobiales bacterium]|nr:HDIG domain-containing protein [Thermomicrobiales bacterium]
MTRTELDPTVQNLLTEAPREVTAPYLPQARETLHEWVESESLRKHCEAVSACMRHFARATGHDEDLWGAVGLLHDMDFEKHPNLELATDGHPFVGVAYLRQNGWGNEVARAILSHADYSGVEPETDLERTLCAVDELSGFVIAVALVRPDKSVHNVAVSSVRKKMKDKAFAAKVNRQDIVTGAERLDMPLEDLIAQVIAALQAESERLGVAGAPAA